MKLSNKIIAAVMVMGITPLASAMPVNLSTWTEESYPAVSGFSPGNWTVSPDNSAVIQSVNGQPTLFYSDFNTFGSSFTGSITVTGSDDDFIGFALGFNAGDTSNSSADYLLIDWKKGDQNFDFGAPSNTPGSLAEAGLAVSRVTGTPTADEFWGHDNSGANPSGGVEELQRASSLGSTGWVTGQTYDFTFDFGPNDLEVYVDGILELDITGTFNDGSFAFYNFSQAGVTYSGFIQEDGSFSVPEPNILALLGMGILGLALVRRKAS